MNKVIHLKKIVIQPEDKDPIPLTAPNIIQSERRINQSCTNNFSIYKSTTILRFVCEFYLDLSCNCATSFRAVHVDRGAARGDLNTEVH